MQPRGKILERNWSELEPKADATERKIFGVQLEHNWGELDLENSRSQLLDRKSEILRELH
jgi:hypothetical protein